MSDPYQPDYLDTPAASARFLDQIRDASQLALDTEGASFHRFVDRIYLLQLSSRDRSAIIDPLASGNLPHLGALVEDPAVEIVFHDADYDLRLLRQDYGWKVTNIFDTRVAAQLLGIKAFGLAALLEQFFAVKLDKKHQRADWSMRPLTADMLDYAAQDTRYLLALRDQLHAKLEKLGRLDWAKEEFARLESVQFSPDEPGTAFLRIKGARDLARRELAILRELVPWRDALAKQLDRSTFRVVGNESLLEIARAAPADRQSLATIKGLSRSILDRNALDILAAVRRGLAVPDNALPKFPKAPRWDRDPEFDDNVTQLKAVRDAAAHHLELDPGVLCSRERLEAIARKRPKSIDELSEIPDLRRWQITVLGPDFIAALKK
jgi:ribonuclease D